MSVYVKVTLRHTKMKLSTPLGNARGYPAMCSFLLVQVSVTRTVELKSAKHGAFADEKQFEY